jgi:hypothetical protein
LGIGIPDTYQAEKQGVWYIGGRLTSVDLEGWLPRINHQATGKIHGENEI